MVDSSTEDVKQRFSNRVDNYIKYRPGYPKQILELLENRYSLSEGHDIADIGAGVGHSTKLLCHSDAYIYAIEPNQDMFDELLKLTKQYSNLSPILQSAENTSLDTTSIDFIVCGQSYHWFDEQKAKTEFMRILKPEGVVVLMWNSWKEDTDFGKAYTSFVHTYNTDYDHVSRTADDNGEKIDYLFRQESYTKDSFEHMQYFDLEGLKGRYMSSSYALLPGMEGFDAAMADLERLFEIHKNDNGKIPFEYTCNVYHGKLQ